jgi:hypothetical protein
MKTVYIEQFKNKMGIIGIQRFIRGDCEKLGREGASRMELPMVSGFREGA